VSVLPSLHDWRTAARRAVANRTAAAVVVAILALGIAATTVVFSVADATMFRGLPYPNGSRLVEIFNVDPGGRFSYPGLDPEAMAEWRPHTELFDAFEGWNYGSFVVVGGAEPAQIGGAFVTPGLFGALGVTPARGRVFQPEDAEPGRDHVVIISDGLWRQRFAADPDVAGKTLTLNDRPFTVIGVMPPHFRFPSASQEVWLPTPPRQPGSGRLLATAILKPDLAKPTAQARLDTLAAALATERPRKAGWRVRLSPSRGVVLNEPTRQALRILTGAVFLVLLIACANVANLFFAQALARSRELAIRAALGASRGRLIRELLAESLLLGAAGGALGLALAYWGIGAAVALASSEITRFSANEIRIDQRMLAFTAAITLGTGLLFGILPAWRVSRAKAGDALKGRTGTSAVAHARLRGTLVVSEVALSCLLLTGAGLLIHSFARLQGLDPGFKPAGVLTVPLSLPTDRYPARARRVFLEQVQQSVEGMRGVISVTVANGVPTSNGDLMFGELQAEDGIQEAHESVIPNTEVAPNYFTTLGLPLRAGRAFMANEPDTSRVISEGFARRLWPDGGALGRRFRLGEGDWLTVVGVAAEVVGNRMVERQSTIEMYSPIWQATANMPTATRSSAGVSRSFVYVDLIVRAAQPLDLVPDIKRAVWAIDPVQPIGEPALAEHLLAKSLTQERFAAVLMGTFAALALVLAAAGLYAVLAQLVMQRRQEIGIRVALGAAAADVAKLIVCRGLGLTAIGVAIGMAGAWTGARVLSSQLFEIAPHDPWSFTTVPVALIAIALLASWIPARRALSVDPASALRTE
jgi:putative ABC transport system permease protein